MSTGGGNQSIKRWDPEKSARDKFVDLGLGTEAEYNFSALAGNLYGQFQQRAQFQSVNEGGYYWGGDSVNSELPRSYTQGTITLGGLFNWYASTAESGKYDTNNSAVDDSICPAGWHLPGGNSGPTWATMMSTTGNGENITNARRAVVRMSPMNLILSGRYTAGSIGMYDFGFYATAIAYSDVSQLYLYIRENEVQKSGSNSKSFGVSVRCVNVAQSNL